MSKVVHATVGTGFPLAAFVVKDYGARTEVFVEARVMFTSAVASEIIASEGELGSPLGFWDSLSPSAPGDHVNIGITIVGWNTPGVLEWWTGGFAGDFITAAHVEPDVWHDLKIHHQAFPTNTLTVTIDGDAYVLSGGSYSGQQDKFGIGANEGVDTVDAYVGGPIKIGTTLGGTDLFTDDFSSGDLSLWAAPEVDGTGSAITVVDDPVTTGTPVPATGVCIRIYDLATNLLADISGIALEKTWKPRHNLASGLIVQAPAGHALLTATAVDGDRILRKGNRKLLAWEDGEIFFHGRIDTVERTGDGTKNLVTITAWDGFMELGYDADGRAGRPVRDSTGNFINPAFTSSVMGQNEISGPDLIYQVLTNSVDTDPLVGEGPLPIHVDIANFELAVPTAIDLTPSDTMDWPVLIGDFVAQLVETGVVDVRMRPIDPEEGLDPYEMNEIFAASLIGTDRSATVHFDYWTGAKNASACRHVESFFATINNKLFDYLGPRIDKQHWRANITPDSPGVIPNPAASRARYGGPGGGQFMSIRIYDSLGNESSSRPLYLALYNAELGLHIEPRDMLFITLSPDSKALFDPPTDYDRGDLVAVNTGTEFGLALAEAQRVYGYDKTWTREGVARVSELITSADAE